MTRLLKFLTGLCALLFLPLIAVGWILQIAFMALSVGWHACHEFGERREREAKSK